MNQSEYWISELAALSGVSTRTIRYYIQEGLLPQPEIRGKYAVFTDEYMHRLRLIKLMKDAYLPLNRIKELLDSLTESQFVPLLEAFEKDPISAMGSLQAPRVFNQPSSSQADLNKTVENDALHYIHRLRGEKSVTEKPAEYGSNASRQSPPRSPQVSPKVSPQATEEWRRIPLAAGLELHVRQPLTPCLQRLVDQLIELVEKQKSFQREE